MGEIGKKVFHTGGNITPINRKSTRTNLLDSRHTCKTPQRSCGLINVFRVVKMMMFPFTDVQENCDFISVFEYSTSSSSKSPQKELHKTLTQISVLLNSNRGADISIPNYLRSAQPENRLSLSTWHVVSQAS